MTNQDQASFDNADRWIKDVHDGRGEDVIIALVGNKIDMVNERVVSSQDGVQKAQKYNVMFVETSAKTRAGIHNLFDNLIEVITGDDEGGEADAAQGQKPPVGAHPGTLV
jgi:Ras-related protein Rab-6A